MVLVRGSGSCYWFRILVRDTCPGFWFMVLIYCTFKLFSESV